MDSLNRGLIADVLKRLHREAEAAGASLTQTFESKEISQEEIITEFIDAETKDQEGVYHGLAGNFLAVSPGFGHILYMCALGCKAKRIVEFGSSMGIPAIYLAAALRDIGGGCLIGTDLEPSNIERTQANVAAAGLADLVTFQIGDARETLKSDVGRDIDVVMLDDAFILNLSILKLLEPHLKPGAIIIGENAFAEARGYIDYVRNPQKGYLSLPLSFEPGRGNEFTVKTTGLA